MLLQDDMKRQFAIILFAILAGLIVPVTYSHAALKDPLPATGMDAGAPGEQDEQKALSVEKLNDIINSIKLQKKEIEAKLLLLKKVKTSQDKDKIHSEINEINNSIAEQELSFEMILTAGLELAKRDKAENSEFDWQKDLLEIVQPIMSELRQLTEYKRKLDNLHKKIEHYQSQITTIKEVLRHVTEINKEGLDKEALIKFEQINKKWRDELTENSHLLEVAQIELEEMTRSQIGKDNFIGDHIRQFIAGRGATLVMALAAFMSVYFSMLLLLRWIQQISRRKRGERMTYYQRIITVCYHFLMVILAIAGGFYVFSVRNDQVLVGVAILLLVFVFWVLKNSIPSYLKELNILLNTGSVREGECIIYNGIPMKIERLNYYTKLINPALPKLKLRLTLAELSNYVSRPYTDDEPWFPCKVGDYVMLTDGTYGLVKCITLESIVLSTASGMMPKTYAIIDFLAANPKNLSQGFFVISDFGIDYQHQEHCTTEIPELMGAGIRKGLLQEAYGESLEDVSVFFAKANTSSLDYKIIAVFNGAAAGDYHAITRALQRYAVETCNQQHWKIPFTQLVIHNAGN